MSTQALLKNLRRISAEILKNTRGVPENLRKSDKFMLLGVAYGNAAVENDFTKWCREQKTRPRYPITEYLKSVDERLGDGEEAAAKPDMEDPRIKPLSATIYDLTGFTPARKSVATLLLEYSEKEILDAAKEYVETLDDKDHKSGMKKFFTDGGCAVVIYAQKNRR